MNPSRRTALKLVGVGVGASLAGCLDLGNGSDGDGDPTGSPTATPVDPSDTPNDPDRDPTLIDHATTPLALRTSAPSWYRDAAANDTGADDDDDAPVGHAVVVDSKSRERAVLGRYDLPPEREDDVDEFLEGVDYDADRVVLVESAGPDGCHDELAIEDVRLNGGRLRGDATVVDDSGANVGCTEALVFPSSVLRVTFDGEPPDAVAVRVTDGWGETATVTAGDDDPLPSPDPADLPGHVRPDAEADPVASLTCETEGTERHGQWFDEADVHWGDFEDDRQSADDSEAENGGADDGEVDLSLRVDDLEYEYGDTATITLTNVSGEEVLTGNRHKYNLQAYTEDGWQDVRVVDADGHFGYTDEGIAHAPGEGFEWTFELTEAGLVDGAFHDDVRVCPALQSGRYRFAYFGVVGDGALAVSFDLNA